jgi:NAD(P)H dehydrogenase (quinone)
MRVLVLYCHPVETSFHAALHARVLASLGQAGHEVDDCDLYAEAFNPVLSREERLHYYDKTVNRTPVERYVHRLLAAEALVLCHPVWNYGLPAMLKGFIDRVFLPGVAFELTDHKLTTTLHNIRKLAVVTTYGQPRWLAFLSGDPPRKLATRYFRNVIAPGAELRFLALYHMDTATDARCTDFLDRVGLEMARF